LPNPNYRAGVRWEREVKKRYEKEGWVVTRCAGSHGPYDLAASKPDESLIRFIQCKRCDTIPVARKVIANLKKHPFLPPGIHYLRRIEVYVASTRETIGAFL